jgi:hypothetical protein
VTEKPRWLLIHPPVVRNCEPPPGLARIAGILAAAGVDYGVLDLNAEGFDWLTDQAAEASDAGTRSALKNRTKIIAGLKSNAGYLSRDRYRRAVSDIGLILKSSVRHRDLMVTPADYQDPALSPLKREDLLTSARLEVDSVYHPLFTRRIAEIQESAPVTHAAVSIGFLSQALAGFALLGHLKARYPRIQTILGGALVTSWVRLGLVNESESFGGLVDHLLAGRAEDHTDLLTGHSVQGSIPDFSLFPLERYLAPGFILPYNASWGCPWRKCTFCPEKSENSPYRTTPVPDVLDALKHLKTRYSPRLIHFTDSETGPAWLKALALAPPGAPWYGFARFSKELADPRFCRELADSGCVMLQLGLESGSQRVLDAMGKGTDSAMNSLIIRNLHEAGIRVFLYVLLGTPEETETDAFLTRDFIVSHAPHISGLNTAIFNMPRFSTETARYATGDFYEGDLSLYCSFEHPSGWTRDKVRRFLGREYETEPAIRSVIRNTPAVFTSSHAPFMQ